MIRPQSSNQNKDLTGSEKKKNIRPPPSTANTPFPAIIQSLKASPLSIMSHTVETTQDIVQGHPDTSLAPDAAPVTPDAPVVGNTVPAPGEVAMDVVV